MKHKHRVLVIGAGSIGERHLRCFYLTGRCDLAVCENRLERRHEITQQYHVGNSAADIESALAFRPTAAVICTPTNQHVSTAIQLAKAGVHMLIEKPLSTELDGVDELNRLVEANQLVASVAYVHRSHPALEQMKAQIESGNFGEPLHLYALGGSHFPTGRPDYREIYFSRRETGGGAIQDALTHIVNAAEWLVGPIDQLISDSDRLALDGIEVEDTVHVIARHGQVMSCYCLNQFQFPTELSITVVCKHGTCRYEPEKDLWRCMTTPGGDWLVHKVPEFNKDKLYLRQANSFLDSIENGTPPLCTLAEAEQSLRVNLQMLEDNNRCKAVNDPVEAGS